MSVNANEAANAPPETVDSVGMKKATYSIRPPHR